MPPRRSQGRSGSGTRGLVTAAPSRTHVAWPASADGVSTARLGPFWTVMTNRRAAVGPFVTVGSVLVLAGGLAAAVSRPFGWDLGPWVAAYLVLVGGVAQTSVGVGQAWIADRDPSRVMVRAELGLWNIGGALTIAGSLLSAPSLSTAGGMATAGSLSCFLVATRRRRPGTRWAATAYRAIVAIVLVSTPIGVTLAWIRHG